MEELLEREKAEVARLQRELRAVREEDAAVDGSRRAEAEAEHRARSVLEAELAKVSVALACHGCTLGDVRFFRQRDGQISGERKDAAPKPDLGCSKTALRLGKKCATPGCTFFDFHDGLCSNAIDEVPKKRRCAAPDRLQASSSGKAARSLRQSLKDVDSAR